MPRSRRCSKKERGSGQYHGRPAIGHTERLGRRLIGFLALVLVLYPPHCSAQALLQIRVLEGEGAVHVAGNKAVHGLVVQVADETGRPVDGVAVSFRAPEEGPGVTFNRGMRTDIAITGADGRAAVHEMFAGRLTGSFQIRITAVKGPVRAGTIASQYVSESRSKGASNAVVARSGGSSRKKWVTILAATGVAAGVALGVARSGGSSGGAAAPAPVPPTIGTPSISIGRP